MDYYVKRGETEKGPYPLDGLRASLKDGSLKGSTLVRSVDGEAWVRLDTVIKPLSLEARGASSSDAMNSGGEGARRRGGGDSDMLIGGLICVVGLLVTAATYSSASGSGGRYVIAWGAIVFGAVRFFRGLASR